MGSDGSGQVKFSAFLLQVFSDSYAGDFSSLVSNWTLAF